MTSGARFEIDFAAGRDYRKGVEKAIRKGLNKGGTKAKRVYVQELSGSSSRRGFAPAKRSGELRRMVRKKVKSVKGSPRLQVGFLYGVLDADQMRKANAVTHGRKNPTKSQRGSITDPRPSAPAVFDKTADMIAQSVFDEVGSVS